MTFFSIELLYYNWVLLLILLFNAVNFQFVKLNNRFTGQIIELLTLNSALSQVEAFKSFKIEDIRSLVQRFYPQEFHIN